MGMEEGEIKMKTKRNKAIIVIIAAVFILTFLAVSTIVSINKYIDTHTWATIRITGEIGSDASDSFDFENEYLKGDDIEIGNVILDITDISHDGAVSFSVREGELYDEAGEKVFSATIVKDVKSNYRLNNGAVCMTVNDNRYQ